MSWVDVTTAVSTAGAVFVALGLGLRAEFRALRSERQKRAEDEHRQAIHVAAWMQVERDEGRGPVEVDVDDPSLDTRDVRVYAVIQNASDEPVWDVVVNVNTFERKREGSSELRLTESEDEVLSIGPHETLKLPIMVMTIPYNRLPLNVEFRDNAGRDWHRDSRARLYRGRESEPTFALIDEYARGKG